MYQNTVVPIDTTTSNHVAAAAAAVGVVSSSSDLGALLARRDLVRKCHLLKSVKIALESLMFERGSASSSSSWKHQPSGTLSMFVRHILECMRDGLVDVSGGGGGGSGRSMSCLWSLLVAVLGSTSDEFKSVRDQLPVSVMTGSNYEAILLDWIFYSLRLHCLAAQIECLLAAASTDDTFLASFSPNAFLLDPQFVHDFLLYLKAFEKNNYAVLTKIKKTLFHLNQDIEEGEAYLSKYKSINIADVMKAAALVTSSAGDKIPVSSSLTTTTARLQSAVATGPSHRRMHSFPNIQINVAKHEVVQARPPIVSITSNSRMNSSQSGAGDSNVQVNHKDFNA